MKNLLQMKKILYPGEYIIEIAKKILKENIKIDYKILKSAYNNLSKESLRFTQ